MALPGEHTTISIGGAVGNVLSIDGPDVRFSGFCE